MHINPGFVFRRALVLVNCDDVTVDKVLSYPIGPIPTAIFHDDGTMRKSCKTDLYHLLEQDVLVSPTFLYLIFLKQHTCISEMVWHCCNQLMQQV